MMLNGWGLRKTREIRKTRNSCNSAAMKHQHTGMFLIASVSPLSRLSHEYS
jgi:hypothetical protein